MVLAVALLQAHSVLSIQVQVVGSASLAVRGARISRRSTVVFHCGEPDLCDRMRLYVADG